LVPGTDQHSFTYQERDGSISESVTINFRWIERYWEQILQLDESVWAETQLFKWVTSGEYVRETVSGSSGRLGLTRLAFVLVFECWAGTGSDYKETDAESKQS
jgi:hypothetical protein